jgi:hypothetical protein
LLLEVSGVNGDILSPAAAVDEPVTEMGINLKMETLPRRNTVTGKISRILVELPIHPFSAV